MHFGPGTRGGFVLVVLAGVLVPGLTNHVLSQSGYHTIGSIIWFGGYATMAAVLWIGWVKPLELTGPDSAIRDPDDEEESAEFTDAETGASEPKTN